MAKYGVGIYIRYAQNILKKNLIESHSIEDINDNTQHWHKMDKKMFKTEGKMLAKGLSRYLEYDA